MKAAIEFTREPSGIPFFDFLKYEIEETEAQEIISTFIDKLLEQRQIKKKLAFYKQHLYGSSARGGRFEKTAQKQIREEARGLLLKKFCRIPEDAFSAINKYKTNEEERRVTFEYRIGFYEYFHIQLIKFYLHLALHDLAAFPLFGIEYDSLKSLIKNILCKNAERTILATLKKGYWKGIPTEIKQGESRLRTFDDVYPYLEKRFCAIVSRRVLGPNYSESAYLRIDHCFAPLIITNAWDILFNIVSFCDRNPPLAISEIKATITLHDCLLKSYRNSSVKDREFTTIEEAIAFTTSSVIHAALQPLKPVIQEYIRGDLNGFIKEWFPVFLKTLEIFKGKYSDRVHPKRWYPAYFEKPVLFAINALEREFETRLKEQQKLKPTSSPNRKKAARISDEENEGKEELIIAEEDIERRRGKNDYENALLDYLDRGEHVEDFSYQPDYSQNMSYLRPFEDETEEDPRRLYFKTNQIAVMVPCSSSILRRKYLPEFIKEGLLTDADIYRKKTDNLRYEVWRICADSRYKVVMFARAKLNKTKSSHSDEMILDILHRVKGKTPEELKTVKAQLSAGDPTRLREAWDNFKRKLS